MIHFHLDVHLKLVGPVLTQSTKAGEFGVDAVMARDSEGKPYLPYSLIRGKLRQALEELEGALAADDAKHFPGDVVHWFGPRTRNREDDHAAGGLFHERGTLLFTDFKYPQAKQLDRLISRIQMDPETGAAAERMLLVVDAPFAYGEEALFEGSIRGICKDFDQCKRAVRTLRAGLRWLTQLGAERTVGFGRVKSAEINQVQITHLDAEDAKALDRFRQDLAPLRPEAGVEPWIVANPCKATSFATQPAVVAETHLVRICPNGLFCFADKPLLSNLFESSIIIPGNALLGALASTYCMAHGLSPREVKPIANGRWQTLAANFSKLRFTHAFPTERGSPQRPAVWPLSLVAAEPHANDIPCVLYDVALCAEPRLILHSGGARPPVFTSDWKGHIVTKKARYQFGWPVEWEKIRKDLRKKDLRKELRVRTAIDPDKGRAEEEKLFGYEMIDPAGFDWLAVLDLSRIEEASRARVLFELKQLLSAPLGPLGKTKTDAKVSIEPVESLQPVVASDANPLPGELWVMVLQTPAILCSREDMQRDAADKLMRGYQRIIHELSGGALTLVRFFAKQSLSSVRFAGGLPRDGAGRYYPFLLTDEGSTFVLKAVGDAAKARACVQAWLDHGLPFAASLAQEIGGGFDPASADAWKHCPILPTNGYGEIVVNPPWLRNDMTGHCWPARLKD